ncbi:class III lanthionine synthetase LanKC [Metasolibacillus sp. FSL H7-0170]|uniref:class III lanthionine synthetase LanKC n=1 Tax=Metasolibacillus sp. FSL H7-0170 TaxID=2921431 RepID=UPI0031586203
MNFLESLNNRYFYEDVSKISAKDEYINIVKDILKDNEDEWRISRSNIYINLHNTLVSSLPKQGWKIHISSNVCNAYEILGIVSKLAKKERFNFKFYMDSYIHQITTEKPYSRSQSGKFITIYPESEENFKELIEKIYHLLKGFEGPYILSDKRYKDCKVLYYRYGAFKSIPKIDIEGNLNLYIQSTNGELILDKRSPKFELPSFVEQPFLDTEIINEEDNALFVKYNNIKALKLTNSGGVYSAISNLTNKEVILKEARPGKTISLDFKLDAIDYRRNEEEILKSLQSSSCTPKVLESFYCWEHYFLVVEKIKGVTLREYVNKNTPFINYKPSMQHVNTYIKEIFMIFHNILDVVIMFHKKGIVLNDISLDNLIIKDDLKVFVIDLESAINIKKNDNNSNAMSTIRVNRDYINIFSGDIYSLGILFSDLFVTKGNLYNLSEKTILNFLEELSIDFMLPNEILDIFKHLTQDENIDLMEIKSIINALHNFQKNLNRKKCSFISNDQLQKIIEAHNKFALDFINKDDFSTKPYTPKSHNPFNISHGIYSLGIKHHSNLKEKKAYYQKMFQTALKNPLIPPGLFTGISGISLKLLQSGFDELAEELLDSISIDNFDSQDYDFFKGKSGYGMVLIYFGNKLKKDIYIQKAETLATSLLGILDYYSCNLGTTRVKEKFNIGLFYGFSGVAQFMLDLYCATEKEIYFSYAEKAIELDLSFKSFDEKGNFGFPRDSININTIQPYLSNGTSGIVAVLLRLAYVSNKKEYLELISQMYPYLEYKYFVYPGLFNGGAGLAYTLLDLYQFFGQDKFKGMAKEVIDGICLFAVDMNGDLLLPGDYLEKISLDFGGGSAGVVSLFNRYLYNHPNEIFINDGYLLAKEEIVFD